MKILITGGTGFIGSRLAWELLEYGHDVTVMTRNAPEPFRGPRYLYHDLLAPIAYADLRDTEVIIHAGAEVAGASSVQNPVRSVRANVLGTFNMLQVATWLNRLQCFIYVSTGEVLGHLDAPAVADESAPLRPSNPYSAAKASGEELCRVWAGWADIPMTIVRPMNVFGPGQKLPRFIPLVMQKILRFPGTSLELGVHAGPMGWGSRNWIHVDDCVEMICRLIHRPSAIETFHLVGPELNNQEVVMALAQGVGGYVEVVSVKPPASHDLRYAAVDTKLGLSGLVTKERVLDQLIQTAAWYQENQCPSS